MRRQKKIVNACITFFCSSSFLFAQQSETFDALKITLPADSAEKYSVLYFYEPYPQKVGESILQLGGSFTLLPIPVMENEYPAPALDLQYKLGLFEKISLNASLSTNIFSNLLHTGVQWNTNANRFSFGFANHIGCFFGFFNTEGQFERNSAYAIYYLPILRFGYRLDAFSVTMSWAASYIFKSTSRVSGLKAPGPEHTVNDYFCTIAIEQPFLKHSFVSIGFSLTYSITPYQTWMMFNTIDQRLFIPEFFFAFQL